MNNFTKTLLTACGVAVASSVITVGAFKASDSGLSRQADTDLSDNGRTDANGRFLTVAQSAALETDFTAAAESTINGVVSIKSYVTLRQRATRQSTPFDDPFFEFFFGTPRRQQQQPQQQPKQPKEQPMGLGSGVIISADGHIVTNNHVIEGAERLEVTLNDNRTYDATVIGTDPTTDLALIKIEADSLHVIPMGSSDNLLVGEWVLAVGNPFGFTSTVTAGIVSAKARSISDSRQGRMTIESYIQTDAAVNPGNSGGALVNLKGELIGINTAIYSQTGNYAGYSFAIPTSIVVKVMTDLKKYGTVQRAVLGITFRELTPEIIKEKGFKNINDGIVVEEVSEGGAAMTAGVKPNDVIVAINGTAIHNKAQFMEQLSRLSPGDKASLTIVRDGSTRNFDVTLLNNQGSTRIVKAPTVEALGAKFAKVADDKLRALRLRSGVQVSEVTGDGRFKRAGIREGFIISDINNGRVSSPEDVEKIYDAIMNSDDTYDKVMFISGVYPTGKKMYYAVDLAD